MLKISILAAATIIFGVSLAHAEKLDNDGVLTKDNGEILSLSQKDALTACPQGTRLPTIHEVAIYNQSRGALGILELNQIKDNKIPPGYLKVEALNPDGSKNTFYYNYIGYKNSAERKWRNPFWSSSVDDGYGLGTYGTTGDIFGYDPAGLCAVRCVPN